MSSIVQYNDWLEEEVLYSKELLVIYTQEEKVLFVKRGCLCFSLLESPWYANLSLDKPQVYHTYSWPKTQKLVTFLKRVGWYALSVFSLSFTNLIHEGLGCLNACALNSGWKRPAWRIMLRFFLGQNNLPIEVSLTAQECKWVSASCWGNLKKCRGLGNIRWTYFPSKSSCSILGHSTLRTLGRAPVTLLLSPSGWPFHECV